MRALRADTTKKIQKNKEFADNSRSSKLDADAKSNSINRHETLARETEFFCASKSLHPQKLHSQLKKENFSSLFSIYGLTNAANYGLLNLFLIFD